MADLCSTCGKHPRMGAIPCCIHCIRAAADADRRYRIDAEARFRARSKLSDFERQKFAENLRARLLARRQAEEAAAVAPPPEPTIRDLLKPSSVLDAKKRRPKKRARGKSTALSTVGRMINDCHDLAETRSPWKAEGISRATWYRCRAQAQQKGATTS
jgi:hypothetical protein